MSVVHRLKRQQAIQTKAILRSLNKTGKALCISPTGTGKTTLITNVLNDQIKGKAKALVITHRSDQLCQVKDRIQKNCPKLNITEYSGSEKELSGQVVIASVQSLGRVEVISKLKRNMFTHILVDEVHHSPATSWKGILTHFKDYKAIGFTATPTRPDGQPLAEMFGEPATQLDIRDAINKNIYAEPAAVITLTSATINGIVGKNGEYKPKDLERLATFEGRNRAIVATYLKQGRNSLKELGLEPKTICYCVNTNHAVVMKNAFIKKGVASEILVSNVKFLDDIDRGTVFNRFKNTHEIEILCVVDLFNEAIDLPNVSCLIMARPSRSVIIYTQQIGRASRYIDSSKEKFVLLDFVDNTRKGFQAYNSTNLLGRCTTSPVINLEHIEGIEDPIKIQERVDALTVIDDFLRARSEFYHTKDDAYEACRKLAINSQLEYQALYKKDPRLPAAPQYYYKNWSTRCIQGFNRAYLKMLSKMPENVKFKARQVWKGTMKKYFFIDQDYGEFKSSPDQLMRTSWKNGLTGHSKRGYARSAEAKRGKGKIILCNETNKIYGSVNAAAKDLGSQCNNILNVLNGKYKQVKGYTFRYLTPDELKAYNARDRHT